MNAAVMLPPHIQAIRDEYLAVELADHPRALEIVDETLAKVLGWTPDDLRADGCELGGEG